MERRNNHTLRFLYFEAQLQRWLVTEGITRIKFQVPVPVVSYNLFMNSVDRFD